MENFEDKAIVDLKKYKKLVEFYDKIQLGMIFTSCHTYGYGETVKYRTESEAVKEVVEYNNKLVEEIKLLNAKNGELLTNISNLNDEYKTLEGRYSKEIHNHKQTKEKLTSAKNLVVQLRKEHNDLLESIKNWSILKFLSERKVRRKKNSKLKYDGLY